MSERETTAQHVAICERYERIAPAYCGIGLPLVGDRLARMMDLASVDGTLAMDWAGLLAADSNNFMHDVIGIHRHMNRKTGKLGDCFLPRFAL